MIPMRDPDCNQVTMTGDPNVTRRCVMPEGHAPHVGHDELTAIVRHKHRLPVPTVTAVFPLVEGGRHRRTPGDHVADGANRVDAALRRWDAVANYARAGR